MSSRRRLRLGPPVAAFVLAAALALGAPSSSLLARPGRDLAAAVPESVGVSTDRLRRLDAGMRGLVTDGRVAGIVSLLTRRGKTVHVGVHGVQDRATGAAMTRDSIFRIYSMTKPVTGVALLMLYEEGKWRLEDPVSRHIPEFARMKVWVGENPDGTPRLEDAQRSMTMRELLTHSGGLGYGLLGSHAVDKMYAKAKLYDSGQPLQALVSGIAALPLLAQPGTRWSYGAGVDVQGYLVEKFSGQSFAEFLRTRLFEPLGMKDTAFYVPQAKLPRLAQVHDDEGARASAFSGGAAPTEAPVAAFGGHGLYSTADDYARFCEMLLGGGELNGVRVLAPRTVEMWRTNHLGAEALKTVRDGTGWGLGPQVVMDAAAAGEPYSDGSATWWGIAGTWFWIDPVRDFAFIGMIQHSGRSLLGVTQIHGYSRNLVYQAILD
jgi:CubicO group peptidase (beta-lactamase class C family)